MPDAPPDPRRLARLADDCLQAALELEGRLQDERQALERQDDEALHAAAAAKRDAVLRLERLEAARQVLCREAGRPAAIEQMPALIACCGADKRVAAAWQEFIDVIAACERRNAANGAAIHLRQRQLAAALGILRGAAEASATTYDARGATGTGGSRRALASI